MQSFFYVYLSYGLSLVFFVGFVSKLIWEDVYYRSILSSPDMDAKNETKK